MIKPILIFIISGLLIIAFALGMGVGTYKWFPYYLVQKTLFTLSSSLTNSTSYSNEIFDDFMLDEAPGETIAFKEEIGLNNYTLHRSPYSSTSVYIVI